MKALFDYFPLILFFVVYKLGGIYPDAAGVMANQYLSGLVSGGVIEVAQAPIMLATITTIFATFLQIGYLVVRRKKVDGMLWFVLGVVTIMGGATIYFNNANFIKWKPTVFYWVAALAFLISDLVFRKNLTRALVDKFFLAPDSVWSRLNFAWIAFFLVLGALNLYIAFNFTMDQWVNFKVFGATGLTFAFIIGQTMFLMKYAKDDPA